MERIMVPHTELSLCPIGLGTLNAGVKWDGKDADSVFDAYVSMGGNLIDTARVYQDWIPGEIGRSERVVGDWLARSGKRNEIILMTKGGHPVYLKEGDDLHLSRMAETDMRKDLELSLRALRTETIDIYLYHRDDLKQPVEQLIDVMERFRKEGKIRFYGCSNWTAPRIREAQAYSKRMGYTGFVVDEAFLNPALKHMNPLPDNTLVYCKDELAAYHSEPDAPLVVSYYSVASGYFHKYLNGGEAAVTGNPYDTPKNRLIAERVKTLAEQYRCGITQVLLAWFSVREYPCVALYGPGRIEQLTEAMETPLIPFAADDLQTLDKV